MADCIRQIPRREPGQSEPACPPLSELERARLAAALGRIVIGHWDGRHRGRRHRARPSKEQPPNLGEHVV